MVLARWRLRRAAHRLAARGWPVTPGAWLRADRFDCGRPGCPTIACHPALERWEQAASVDPDRIAQWWRELPHGVLLPTGHAFDVIEVPCPLGAHAVGSRAWRGPVRGPVATTPTGRWMFFVRTGAPLLPELAARLDVVRHARGSWVPAPPTRLVDQPVRWSVPPPAVGWRLPDAPAVQQLLVACGRDITGAAGEPAPVR
jgi:hypothetical protein